MTGTRADEASFRGACVFGTAAGHSIRGVGCFAEVSRELLRLLDFGTQKLERGETAWFVLPFAANGEHGKLIGQVGFANDFKGREGFVGVAVAATDTALARTGYSGSVYLVEKLYPWFSSSFDPQQGDATFTQADAVLGQLGVLDSAPAEVHHEEALRLKLPRNWQSFISIPELMGILPGYVQYAEIARRGFVLRMREQAQCDVTLPVPFLTTWRQELYGPRERQKLESERLRLTELLNQTYQGYREQEQSAASLKGELDHRNQVIGDLKQQVHEESSDRARLAYELQQKATEADTAQKALQQAIAASDQLAIDLNGTRQRLDLANRTATEVTDQLKADRAQLTKVENDLIAVRNDGVAEARRLFQAERQQLVDQIGAKEKALNRAMQGIQELNADIQTLKVAQANAENIIEGYRQHEALPPRAGGQAGTRVIDDAGGAGGRWKEPRSGGSGAKRLRSVEEMQGGSRSKLLILSLAILSMVGGVALFGTDSFKTSLPYCDPIHPAGSSACRPIKGGPVVAGGGQDRGRVSQRVKEARDEIEEEEERLKKIRERLEKQAEDQQRKLENEWKRVEDERNAIAKERQKLNAEKAKGPQVPKREARAKAQAAQPLEATPNPPTQPVTPVTPPTAPIVATIPPPKTNVAPLPDPTGYNPSHCGTNPEYAERTKLFEFCAQNWNDIKCVKPVETRFTGLIEALKLCEIATSDCAGLMGELTTANARRPKNSWFDLNSAKAADQVLACVKEAWRRRAP
ncbi:MAG: hypothetical protein ACKVP7_25050 [Hyphomicrobiaceae bacterium]